MAAAVFVILNFDYFRKNVEYELKQDQYQQTLPLTREKIEPNKLLIPSLNVDVPVIYAERVNEDHFQELLINGVVHYPGTAKAGEAGNVYIFGHSSDNAWSPGKYKTVFALLPKMKIGEKIYISDEQGNKYVYEVREARAIEKDDLSVLAQDHSKKLLTLQTSYPAGTSLKRYAVVAELVE